MNKKTLGQLGEEITAHLYQKRGYKLLAKNLKFFLGKQAGELDLVFTQYGEIVFVEVKTRTGSAIPHEDAFDFRKSRKTSRAAKLYLLHHPEYHNYFARIDVALVKLSLDGTLENVKIIEDAIQDE